MQLRAHHHYPSRRSSVVAHNMVATSQPLAAQAGLQMIARGGNAADAAIASAITLTLVEPTGCGIGSDAFAILWDGQQLHGLNASGRAPARFDPKKYQGMEKLPFRGWDSVTVPGVVSGWVAVSEKFGKLPFADLFEPAIQYAETGFPVSPVIATLWAKGGEFLSGQPGFAEAFLPGGRAPGAGEIFSSPEMARTFRLIAETKGKAFYEGDLADAMEAFAKAHDAPLRVTDLAAHRAEWCGTISKGFDDLMLHEIPPNSQGIAALMALGILDHTNIRDLDADDPRGFHLQLEAMKLALADTLEFVGDLDHMTRITREDMLDDGYLAERAKLIDPAKATNFKSGAPKLGSTVYLTAADETGMMVSFIQSNYSGFGSGVVVPGTGISLQNRGAGFSLDPKSQNMAAPRKRPFHTIIPGFLMKENAPLMSFGVMGGPIQAQGHLQMVLRTQLWGQDPQMAADAPRWRVNDGLGVSCEHTFPNDTLEALSAMGHQLTLEAPDSAFGFGGAQLIQKLENGAFAGGSEPRKDGQVVGF